MEAADMDHEILFYIKELAMEKIHYFNLILWVN